jgi:hypothetical protein
VRSRGPAPIPLAVLVACVGGCAGGGGGAGAAAGDAGGGSQGPAGAPPPAGRFFPDGEWYRDVSAAPLDPEAATVVDWLDGEGWGLGRMQIDFSLEVLEADASTPLRSFTATDDFFSPDCDAEPVPVPPGGALEGEAGYACESDGDCHLIVVHRPSLRLFEMWRADIRGDVFRGGCLAVWDMARVYPPEGRGEQCTGADAAGYPIAPLLFTADEVTAGSIDHAIRFILPNSRIRRGEYVHPATHGTPAASGPASAPPYGTGCSARATSPSSSPGTSRWSTPGPASP